MEAAAEYLLQRHKAKELGCPFHQATLKQLEIIMGRDAEATPQTPIAEDAMRRLLYTSAPSSNSFENIIHLLSSPMPLQQANASSGTSQNIDFLSNNQDCQEDSNDATTASLNMGQKAVFKLLGDYFRAEAVSRKNLGPKPEPPRLFVDGGPGTGKTYLINYIKQHAEKFGLSVMTCAYTGNAVDNLPKGARTIHGTFGFKVADKYADMDYEMGAKQKKLIEIRKNVNVSTVCLLIIDEISSKSAYVK